MKPRHVTMDFFRDESYVIRKAIIVGIILGILARISHFSDAPRTCGNCFSILIV